MRPQKIEYKEGGIITKLDNTNTLLVNSSDLEWGNMAFPPILLIKGFEINHLSKFEFVKAYLDNNNKIKHCEYKNDVLELKLIVYNK